MKGHTTETTAQCIPRFESQFPMNLHVYFLLSSSSSRAYLPNVKLKAHMNADPLCDTPCIHAPKRYKILPGENSTNFLSNVYFHFTPSSFIIYQTESTRFCVCKAQPGMTRTHFSPQTVGWRVFCVVFVTVLVSKFISKTIKCTVYCRSGNKTGYSQSLSFSCSCSLPDLHILRTLGTADTTRFDNNLWTMQTWMLTRNA